jgi:hypothetical protein
MDSHCKCIPEVWIRDSVRAHGLLETHLQGPGHVAGCSEKAGARPLAVPEVGFRSPPDGAPANITTDRIPGGVPRCVTAAGRTPSHFVTEVCLMSQCQIPIMASRKTTTCCGPRTKPGMVRSIPVSLRVVIPTLRPSPVPLLHLLGAKPPDILAVTSSPTSAPHRSQRQR